MAPLAYAVLAVIVVLLSTAEGFAKQGALGQFVRRTRASTTSQYSFTPGPRDGERKITREKDAEGEYFESDFDRRPIKERLPVALGFLGAVSLPFIIGLIYLYSNK
jgi:hypothetical protein